LGIIMRTGEAFQTFGQVTRILLDKAGTLTAGHPGVAGLRPAPGTDAADLLAVTAAAEAPSEHPLAQAITTAARQQRLELPPADPEGFAATAGSGVTARIGGHRVLAGRPSFLAGHGLDMTAMAGAITRLESEGHTVVAVARGTRVLGVIALADTLRPEAIEAVAALRDAGLAPVLVTGDNPPPPPTSPARLASARCTPGCCPTARPNWPAGSRPAGTGWRWSATASTTPPR
jgi:P-type Cu+ transporter